MVYFLILVGLHLHFKASYAEKNHRSVLTVQLQYFLICSEVAVAFLKLVLFLCSKNTNSEISVS